MNFGAHGEREAAAMKGVGTVGMEKIGHIAGATDVIGND